MEHEAHDAGPFAIRRWSYYADFLAAPVLIVGLLSAADGGFAALGLSFMVGLVAWSLFEYLLHRFVFHRVQPFKRLHDVHHDKARAYVGLPPWVLWPAAGVLVVTATVTGFQGGLAGVVAGYLAYIVFHDRMHHGSPVRWPRVGARGFFWRQNRRHYLHHTKGLEANYGVTTPLWDMAFRTWVEPGARAR